MILLWGLSGDGPLDEVEASLRGRGVPFALLDQRDVLDTRVESEPGRAFASRVLTRDGHIDLDAVTACYLRAHDFRRLPHIEAAGPESAAWSHAVAVESALYAWVELTPALVVNRPSAMSSNNSKPYQAALIGAHGFAVPETLITTDPAAVEEFRARHGALIYKSISSVRSIVSRLTPDHDERLADVAWCPTQFQQYVPGTDYRVHVIGEELFTCEVISVADDYRYAGRQGAGVEIRPCGLPPEVGEKLRTLVRALGLCVAGVDLRRTPDGEWFCFEVNPSPGFTFYEPDDEQPIADAIARLLAYGVGTVYGGASTV
jgi:hypothetical protein